jgi:uncharacterized RDD family membrane protein YckC
MAQENPYQPPSSVIDAAVASHSLEPAGRGRRFGTFVVDYVGFMLLGLVVGMILGLILGEEGIKAIQKVPDFVFGIPVFFGYYAFFEGIWARTPGKWLFGTVVVSEAGHKPTIGQVLGRTACRFIPFEAFSFFGTSGWHDSIPKTRVVRFFRQP